MQISKDSLEFLDQERRSIRGLWGPGLTNKNVARPTHVTGPTNIFLLIKHAELSSTFSEVITACLLYLTLPVTVASAERSFSKLKLIKTYLRSTMCQVRLSSLGMLSIKSHRLNDQNVEKMIDIFADVKARR